MHRKLGLHFFQGFFVTSFQGLHWVWKKGLNANPKEELFDFWIQTIPKGQALKCNQA